MRAGVFNIVMGLAAVALAATGHFALPFTNSPAPLMVVGGAIAALGVYQLVRSKA